MLSPPSSPGLERPAGSHWLSAPELTKQIQDPAPPPPRGVPQVSRPLMDPLVRL